MLGKQISELGNQSQELQNKLDAKYIDVKKVVNLMVDNLIAEGIRKARKLDEHIEELQEKITIKKKEKQNTKFKSKNFMKDLEEFQRYFKKLNKKMKFKTNNVKFIIIK